MAEAVAYMDSPIADYLRQNGEGDDLLPSAPSTNPSLHPSTSTSTRTPSPSTPSRPPPPRRTQTRHAASIERVKYALATSALLSAKLGDALQLYPPLEALEKQRAAAGRSKGKGKAQLQKRDVGEVKAEWPSGWDSAGQGMLERGVLGNAQAALSGLAGALSLFSKPDQASVGNGAGLATVEEEEPRTTPQEAVLASVERFIAASQELDLRVAAALTAIKELESDPLPPISRIEARAHAPSSSPSSSPSPNPPPLRALALRTSLSQLLSSALSALSTSTADLNALLPRGSPLLQLQLTAPTPALSPSSSPNHTSQASLSELLRHDTRARLERDEVERWEGASASGGSRPTSVAQGEGSAFDPFHPTESTFGGIDRRVAIGDAGTPARRGLKSSLGPGSGASAGSPLRADPPASARKKRPLSLGGVSAALSPSDAQQPPRTPSPSSPAQDLTPFLLITLQDTLETLHDTRRGVIWRLLESLSHAQSDTAWNAIDGLVDSAARRVGEVASEVGQAHEREFGTSKPEEEGEGLERRRSERRRRSGYYSRTAHEIEVDLPQSGTSTSPVATGLTPTTAKARGDALARLNGGPKPAGPPATPTNSSRAPPRSTTPASYANFAPSASPSPADNSLASHTHALSLLLRSIQAKLRVVTSDTALLATMRAEEVDERREKPPSADETLATRQALLDATLSLSLLPPTTDAAAEEKVFEAVAGPPSSSRMYGPDGSKLSRDERIRRMREAREALQRGRESLESSPTKERGSIGGTAGGVEEQQKMVGELREVLRELNREKGRETPEPPRPAPAPMTPSRATTALPPPIKASPAPMPPKIPPFPTGPRFAPSPPVSPQRSAFAPPPPPPAVRSPPPFAPSPTTARSPPPATNRPPPPPPSYAPSGSPPLPPPPASTRSPPPPPQQQPYQPQQRVKRPSVVQTV
ncbi:Pathogenesis-related protein 1-like protein [Rhodotorula toruloides ATCC 204091]|nr:Pathogenesis-related protein 1-like protein [Rhodotorula toruloides ATCC 204091]